MRRYTGWRMRSPLEAVAGRVREGERGLSSLGRRVRPERLAAPARSAVRLDSTVGRAPHKRVGGGLDQTELKINTA